MLFIIYKNSETTYYKRHRKTILNRGKEYYENNKEVLRQKTSSKKQVQRIIR